jgi:hypothetical protein
MVVLKERRPPPCLAKTAALHAIRHSIVIQYIRHSIAVQSVFQQISHSEPRAAAGAATTFGGGCGRCTAHRPPPAPSCSCDFDANDSIAEELTCGSHSSIRGNAFMKCAAFVHGSSAMHAVLCMQARQLVAHQIQSAHQQTAYLYRQYSTVQYSTVQAWSARALSLTGRTRYFPSFLTLYAACTVRHRRWVSTRRWQVGR